jgi:hypothetical protein
MEEAFYKCSTEEATADTEPSLAGQSTPKIRACSFFSQI